MFNLEYSERQLHIMKLKDEGRTESQIARELGVSKETIRKELRFIARFGRIIRLPDDPTQIQFKDYMIKHLPTREFNVICRWSSPIETYDDFLALTERDVFNRRGAGTKTVNTVVELQNYLRKALGKDEITDSDESTDIYSDINNDIIVKNIDYLLTLNNMTRRDLESSLNLSAGYISRIANSKKTLSLNHVYKIASILNTTVDGIVYYHHESAKYKDDLDILCKFIDKLKADTYDRKLKWCKVNSNKYSCYDEYCDANNIQVVSTDKMYSLHEDGYDIIIQPVIFNYKDSSTSTKSGYWIYFMKGDELITVVLTINIPKYVEDSINTLMRIVVDLFEIPLSDNAFNLIKKYINE